MIHAEYAKYTEEPLTRYRQDVFQKLLNQISGGRVCDLGCHSVGHYWALGYAERVDEIALYDISQEALELQQKAIESLSPDDLNIEYGDTVDFLQAHNLASGDANQMSFAIQEKVDDIVQFDFLNDTPQHQFDWVIAIESLEIIRTLEEYQQSFSTAKQLLKPETGNLLAVVLPYLSADEDVMCLAGSKLEGTFNPNMEDTHYVLKQNGFADIAIEEVPTNMRNYPNAYFIKASH